MTPYNSALITGASSGIGRALAEALAAPGVTLHLGGRNANRLEQTAIACRAKGAVAHVAPVDVTNAEATAAWIAAAAPLDLVIANAGISGGTGIASGETAAQARAIFATNLDGALNTAFPALETMAPGGTIAVVASVAAFIPTPGAPAYGASKSAIDAWTVAAAPAAAQRGIHLVSICPGFIRTPMTAANPYNMPGLMDADRAAAIILRALPHHPRRIVFPWWMGAIARSLALVTPVVALMARIQGKPALPRPE